MSPRVATPNVLDAGEADAIPTRQVGDPFGRTDDLNDLSLRQLGVGIPDASI
jgi:hypothetical protein